MTAKWLASALLAGALMATGSAANAQMGPDGNINPWQDCGLGAMVFPDNGTAAAISNVIWDWGSTAVTSATASPDMCEGAKAQMAKFIDSSYDSLSVETARGEGQHLATLTGIMGCAEGARGEAIAALRADMATATAQAGFAGVSRQDKAKLYYGSAVQAAASTNGCTLG